MTDAVLDDVDMVEDGVEEVAVNGAAEARLCLMCFFRCSRDLDWIGRWLTPVFCAEGSVNGRDGGSRGDNDNEEISGCEVGSDDFDSCDCDCDCDCGCGCGCGCGCRGCFVFFFCLALSTGGVIDAVDKESNGDGCGD